MKRTSCVGLGLLLIAALAAAQESTRRLDRLGEHTKHLTPNQVDNWVFLAEKDEVVTARVETNQFDAIVKLVDAADKVLAERDDPGSSASLAFRLRAAGEYRLQVHAFQHAGGGNYALVVDRFKAAELPIGRPAAGRIGGDGRLHYRFEARPGQILVPRVQGQVGPVEILEPQGRPIPGWQNTATIRTAGEHFLRLRGQRSTAYRLALLAAEEFHLEKDGKETRRIEPGALHVWSFPGEPGDFRVAQIDGARQLTGRLVPIVKLEEEKPQASLDPRKSSLRLLPVACKGDRLRYAAVIGRKDRYQLQLFSHAAAPVQYTLTFADPTTATALGQRSEAVLAVGGSDFYRFEANAGQFVVAELTSDSFDPFLRLFRADGQELVANDDGGEHLGSRIGLLIPESGTYRLQVTSVGNGGGGAYCLRITERTVPNVALGGRATASLGPGGRDLWRFAGKRGTRLFVSVHSRSLDPIVEVLAPSSASLGRDDNGGVGADALLAVELSEDGRHTIIVTSKAGEGEYQLRLIDERQ